MFRMANGFLNRKISYLSLLIWQYASRHSLGNKSSNVDPYTNLSYSREAIELSPKIYGELYPMTNYALFTQYSSVIIKNLVTQAARWLISLVKSVI